MFGPSKPIHEGSNPWIWMQPDGTDYAQFSANPIPWHGTRYLTITIDNDKVFPYDTNGQYTYELTVDGGFYKDKSYEETATVGAYIQCDGKQIDFPSKTFYFSPGPSTENRTGHTSMYFEASATGVQGNLDMEKHNIDVTMTYTSTSVSGFYYVSARLIIRANSSVNGTPCNVYYFPN